MKSKIVFFLIFFSFLFLFLSYLPNIYEVSLVNSLPADRVMVWGEHIYTYDYNVYLSKIRQGQEGRWSVVDKYDNHPDAKGIFLQMLYLLAGKLGGVFHFTPVFTFQILRTILSVAWVMAIIFLNVYFLRQPNQYVLGIIFSLLAAGWGHHMDWWQEMDVLKRLSYVPHYTFSYISIAIASVLFFKNRYFIVLCLLVFLLFLVQPSGALLIFGSWFIYHLLKRPFPWKKTIILIVVALIPLLYIHSVTATYPWKSLVDFEKNYPLPFNLKEYILALGPIFFTGVAGLILVLWKRNSRLLPLASWVLAAAAGMTVFTFLPSQSPLRFVQTANHIPLAILSVYFLSYLVRRKGIFLTSESPGIRGGDSRVKKIPLPKIIATIIITVIIVNGLYQTVLSLKHQFAFIHQRVIATLPLVPYPPQVMYPLTDFWQAIMWLKNNTPETAVVLSQYTAGNYIPAYAGNFVYLGHGSETPHFDARSAQVNAFFSGVETADQAKQFLIQNNITYVFYGPQEKENAVNDINAYPFLKPVYRSALVTIFRFQK